MEREATMSPKVGGKRFSYTAKGMKAAKAYGKKTGKKVKKKKR
jgi:hypothetical protein